jgi:hypothetical protein
MMFLARICNFGCKIVVFFAETRNFIQKLSPAIFYPANLNQIICSAKVAILKIINYRRYLHLSPHLLCNFNQKFLHPYSAILTKKFAAQIAFDLFVP